MTIMKDSMESKSIEQRLKEVEKLWHSFTENSKDTILIADNNNIIQYINRAVPPETPQDIIGKSLYDYVLEEQYEIMRSAIGKANKTGKAQNFEHSIDFSKINPKVGLIWCNTQVVPITTERDVFSVLIIVSDFTERKRIENDLKLKDNAIRASINAIAFADLAGNLTYVNPSFLKIWRYSSEKEVLGKSNLDFWQMKEKAAEVIKNLQETGSWIGELTAKRMDGSYFDVQLSASMILDSSGKTISMMASFIDITQRKKLEQKLKESKVKYRKLFDKSPYSIMLIDINDIILDCNPITEKIFGYKNKELIDKNFRELDIFYDNNLLVLEESIKGLTSGRKTEKVEIQIMQKNGNIIWISILPSFIRRGDELLFQVIIQDITSRKEVEQLRNELTKSLEEKVMERTKDLEDVLLEHKLYLDQIAKASQFKSEFLATMSHELRTPLNAIIGFTDLLLEGAYGELNEDQLEFLNDIKNSAEHQFEMIKHVLNISKIEAGQLKLNKKSFSLNNIIEQIKSELKPLYFKKDLKFKVKGLDEEKQICADPIRFKEILYNLLSNAIKFTPEGKITFIVQDKYKNWTFKVRDTGIGIARKDYDLIFKEFTRINSTYVNSTSGTGLGLSVTKRLINLHGGDITFTSVLGVGTTFTFTIPKNLDSK